MSATLMSPEEAIGRVERSGDVLMAARTAHEVNRAYCNAKGDVSQLPWDQAPQWARKSSIDGVRYVVEHPTSTPRDVHNNWLRCKFQDGWTWGPVKDPDKKQHPCMIDYDMLPLEQRIKDHLFQAVVRSILELG